MSNERDEFAELRAALACAPEDVFCDPTTIARLLAAADRAKELEADARRYRWLRDSRALYLGPVVSMGVRRGVDDTRRFILPSTSIGSAPADVGTLDAAIDRASGAST